MKIEIEKQFELTTQDYEVIKQKCEFISKKEIIDIYLDTDNYIVFNKNYRARIRNWKPELKIKSYNKVTKLDTSFEYETIKEIEKELEKLWIKFEDLIEVLEVKTNREKYKYFLNWIEFIVDIDIYKYWKRYEIELLFDDDSWIDWAKLINDFRKHIWLNSKEQDESMWKIRTTSKFENKKLYEIISNLEK